MRSLLHQLVYRHEHYRALDGPDVGVVIACSPRLRPDRVRLRWRPVGFTEWLDLPRDRIDAWLLAPDQDTRLAVLG